MKQFPTKVEFLRKSIGNDQPVIIGKQRAFAYWQTTTGSDIPDLDFEQTFFEELT